MAVTAVVALKAKNFLSANECYFLRETIFNETVALLFICLVELPLSDRTGCCRLMEAADELTG
jgi:hypothetical protein